MSNPLHYADGRADLLARDRALLVDTVREAGLLALAMRRTQLRTWTKGVSSPVSEADIAVNDLIEASCARLRITAGCPRKAPTIFRGSASRGCGSSIRSTARAAISPAMTNGASALLWSRVSSPLLAAVFAPATDEFFLAERGQGATCNGSRSGRRPAMIWIFPESRGRSRFWKDWTCRPNDVVLHPRISSLALRLCRVAERQDRCGLCRRPEPRLGSRRCRFDRA